MDSLFKLDFILFLINLISLSYKFKQTNVI